MGTGTDERDKRNLSAERSLPPEQCEEEEEEEAAAAGTSSAIGW
jgi:hypothetical protein